MKRGEQLSIALVLATNGHAGQFDKGGNPYILHPLAVMQKIPKTGDTEVDEIRQGIAVLHDLIEDTKTTYQELRDAGICERIIEGVKCLTKIPGESYDEYREKVKSNPDSVVVKLCDLEHNTDIKRLRGVTEKDIKRMEKYFHFYMELQAHINGK